MLGAMRGQYIERQKREHGRKVLAVLPIHYPKEILTAMNILAVELWGPPGPPRSAAAGRLQTYVCSVVRNATAFLCGGQAEVVDGVLFPHTCDSIQGMATLVTDLGGWRKPTFCFIHPRGERRESLISFLTAELADLARKLAAFTGEELDLERLRWAISLHGEIHVLRRELLHRRSCLGLRDPELYHLLRRGEFLWPEEHLQELRAARESLAEEPVQHGVPLLITGYVPEPMSLFELLEEAGAYVAADDYAAVGRRVLNATPDAEGDPFLALAEMTLAAKPCPTRSTDQSRRIGYLRDLLAEQRAAGVMIHEVKFCEPQLFDVPAIKTAFAELGVPTLYLESELESELTGQTTTRVEAFVEMVASAGERA